MIRTLGRIEDDLLRFFALWFASPAIFGKVLVVTFFNRPAALFRPVLYSTSWAAFWSAVDGNLINKGK